MQNLTKERKQPPVVILQEAIYISARMSDQGVLFKNFSFTDVF